MARFERYIHTCMYPTWSAKDNYARNKLVKKNQNEKVGDETSSQETFTTTTTSEDMKLDLKTKNVGKGFVGSTVCCRRF